MLPSNLFIWCVLQEPTPQNVLQQRASSPSLLLTQQSTAQQIKSNIHIAELLGQHIWRVKRQLAFACLKLGSISRKT